MFCTQCGKEIEDDAMVCPYCGIRLRAENTDSMVVESNLSAGNMGTVQEFQSQPYQGVSQGYQGQPYSGVSQGYQSQSIPEVSQGYQGQPYQGVSQGYQGQPYQGVSQGYQGQPYQGVSQGYQGPVQNMDDKFVLWAGLGWIGIIWCFANGLWDLALLQIVIFLIRIPIFAIPIAGALIDFAIWIATVVLIGRNANYYKRLKREMNLMPYQAFKDPNLRRI